MLGMRLCVLHNLYFYNHLMEEIRTAIEEGRYKEFKKAKLERNGTGRITRKKLDVFGKLCIVISMHRR